MKTFIKILISLILPAALITAAGTSPAFSLETGAEPADNGEAAKIEAAKGDVNGDGRLNLSDCADLARFCANIPVPAFYVPQADIDGDGDGDITDLVMLLRHLTGYDAPQAVQPKDGSPPAARDAAPPAPAEAEGNAPEGSFGLSPEDAGKIYLAAVDAAGKAYDEASGAARASFEEAAAARQDFEDYNKSLASYKDAVAKARAAYDEALAAARAILNSSR